MMNIVWVSDNNDIIIVYKENGYHKYRVYVKNKIYKFNSKEFYDVKWELKRYYDNAKEASEYINSLEDIKNEKT